MCSETFLIPTCICLFDFNPNPNLRDSISFAYRFRILAEAGLKFEPKNMKVGHNFFYAPKNEPKNRKLLITFFFSSTKLSIQSAISKQLRSKFSSLCSIQNDVWCSQRMYSSDKGSVERETRHENKTNQDKTKQIYNSLTAHSFTLLCCIRNIAKSSIQLWSCSYQSILPANRKARHRRNFCSRATTTTTVHTITKYTS